MFHQTGGYEWDEPSLEVLRRASSGSQRGDAAAVLRELLDEPSGLIENLLQRLGVEPETIRLRLSEVELLPAATLNQRPPGKGLSGTSESFVPAPIEQVWALLADPTRPPEWDPSIGSVVPDTAGHSCASGEEFLALARSERPDGKPIRVSPKYRRQRVELLDQDEPSRIAWRFSYPDAERANSRGISVALEPAAGGTHLRISLSWDRAANQRFSPLGWLLRPLARFSIWMQLSQLGGTISRAFR